MRRRTNRPGVEPPALLRIFDAADWGPADVVLDREEMLHRVEKWRTARHAFHDENGWPGEALSLLREDRAVRRSVARQEWPQ